MDGLATVRALWEVDHRLEVVICTAWSDHTLEDLRAGLGSRSRFLVLRKPFDPIEVQQLAGALGEKWLLARRAEARAQAEQLELLGRLAGGIAHDLNNVLAAILGYTELARLRLGPHAAASELLTRIAEAGGQGRRIASRLLALARRRPPMPERVEFDPLLAELQPLLVQLAGGTCGIDIRTGAAGAAVLLDQAQAAQILLNLTVNARDAMADGGMIRIATGIDHAGGRLVLEVGDDGPGIPPDVRRHLFEPFFTTKAPGRGSGMGLGVVQDAVRSAAGSIQVHSAPGEGTTFRIELPLAGLPEPARPPSPLTGVRVLMVDDDASICELVRITVEGAGGRCRTVLDHDAADLARADEPVDVLISDLRLGGQDADATLRRLARDWSGTPCVVVSGDLPDRLPAGVHGLAKPFSPTALVELTADLARPAG
jgi:signal transduction histidine kinase